MEKLNINLSTNAWSSNSSSVKIIRNFDNLMFEFYNASKWMNVIFISMITVLGVYGNFMSLNVFLHKSYRNVKALRYYLIILSISDMFVLVLHYVDFTFRSWVNLIGAYSSKFNFVDKCLLCCKLIPYFRNVFRTISVYILLMMTFQRFMVLFFPLNRAKWLSVKFNKKLIYGLIISSLIFNINNIFLNSLIVHELNGEIYCSIHKDYLTYQFVIDILFVVLTILVPTVLVLTLSFILLSKINHNSSMCRSYFCFCYRNLNKSNKNSIVEKYDTVVIYNDNSLNKEIKLESHNMTPKNDGSLKLFSSLYDLNVDKAQNQRCSKSRSRYDRRNHQNSNPIEFNTDAKRTSKKEIKRKRVIPLEQPTC